MKTVSVNGANLATVDRGQGMAVVLIHGFPLDHQMWNAQVDVLAQHCRVIAPDLRGFGSSSMTEGVVRMEQFADDLAALLDALGVREPAVVCGLSMGGYVAFEFWRRHPDRLRALVLCDTRAAADAPEAAKGRLETARKVLEEGVGVLADTMTPKLLSPGAIQTRPDMVNSLRGTILNCPAQGAAAALCGMAERSDFTARLAEIRCPTLVLVGSEDAISTPEEMAAIAYAIPGARLIRIEHAGHLSPIEQPAQVNAAIGAFLAELRESETATGS